MARENTVDLYGWVACTPEFVKPQEPGVSPGELKLTVMAIRRSYFSDEQQLKGKEKEDYIPVRIKNAAMVEKVEKELFPEGARFWDRPEDYDPGYKGYLVRVKGTLCTTRETIFPVCPCCGEVNAYDRNVTYVDPVFVRKAGFGRALTKEEAVQELRDHVEVSNSIYIYGAIWRDPEYYREGITELRFPIKATRKRHIYEDPEDKKADYPWVRSFGDKNAEFARNLHKGSSLYIRGSLQSRKFDGQVLLCGACGEPFEISGEALEIIPYSMKYRNRCGTEEEEYPVLAKTGMNENTALLYGWVSGPVEVSPDHGKASIPLRVARKRYDTEDPVKRGQMRTETVIVKTENPWMVSRIEREMTAAPLSTRDGPVHIGYMLLVKGTLYQQTSAARVRCPCGGEYEAGLDVVCVDPAGIWKEEGPFDSTGMFRVLRECLEVSDTALCHGVVKGEPALIGGKPPECVFEIETDRIRRREGEGGATDRPCVTATGRKAFECSDALHDGSLVFLDGAVRSCVRNNLYTVCPSCGRENGVKMTSVEIIPYQVEYHADCDLPEPARIAEEEDEAEDEYHVRDFGQAETGFGTFQG